MLMINVRAGANVADRPRPMGAWRSRLETDSSSGTAFDWKRGCGHDGGEHGEDEPRSTQIYDGNRLVSRRRIEHMVYADLHVHTDCSDGQLSLAAVPVVAWRAGVDVVAVTDHDRVHPDLEAPVVETAPDDADPEDADPITVIRGIELRVEAGDQRVDLLGYGLERTDELESLVDRVQTDRKERGRKIIERVEDRLGVDLDIEPREGLGRPHVARAIDDHEDTDLSYEGAFEELIGDGGPCYVARNVPSLEEGRTVLDDACGLVGLAHPLRYDDPDRALELCADLDAVELHYPYEGSVDTTLVARAIEDHDLAATGGSDAHDDRLGRAGLAESDYRHIRGAITQGSSGSGS